MNRQPIDHARDPSMPAETAGPAFAVHEPPVPDRSGS